MSQPDSHIDNLSKSCWSTELLSEPSMERYFAAQGSLQFHQRKTHLGCNVVYVDEAQDSPRTEPLGTPYVIGTVSASYLLSSVSKESTGPAQHTRLYCIVMQFPYHF